MQLVLNGINSEYLRNILENAKSETERVDAAVAYAADHSLFDWCLNNKIPLRFWGRFDEGVPVAIPILKKFLTERSPNFVCRLIPHFHAKIIWWRGYGAYIGSANLTEKAWWNNVEAGFFVSEAELLASGQDLELEDLLKVVQENSAPLTQELFELLESRNLTLSRKNQNEKSDTLAFLANAHSPKWGGLARTTAKSTNQRRREQFLKEWSETLQTIRDLSQLVAMEENRPVWVRPDTPPGSQIDQFLHAHYYQRTFDSNRRATFEEHFERNKKDRQRAVDETLVWWRDLPNAPNSEDKMLNEWAPFLRENLSEERVLTLTEDDLAQVFSRVHAIRDHARRVANRVLRLPEGRTYAVEEKIEAFAKFAYQARSENGETILQRIHHVLYGGSFSGLPERIWDTVSQPQLRIEHFGISAIGELVGWALPDQFPPRNGRTSKALRSLGFDVQVHS